MSKSRKNYKKSRKHRSKKSRVIKSRKPRKSRSKKRSKKRKDGTLEYSPSSFGKYSYPIKIKFDYGNRHTDVTLKMPIPKDYKPTKLSKTTNDFVEIELSINRDDNKAYLAYFAVNPTKYKDLNDIPENFKGVGKRMLCELFKYLKSRGFINNDTKVSLVPADDGTMKLITYYKTLGFKSKDEKKLMDSTVKDIIIKCDS
jgi:hypothetical protein